MLRKSFLAILSSLLLVGSVSAQITPVVMSGTFQGTQKDIDNAVKAGKLEFVISSVGPNQIDFLKQKSVPYAKDITIAIKGDNVKSSANVTVTLPKGTQDMKWLFRWFLSTDIKYVIIEGKSIKMEDFFAPYI
jgi:hypothetical protein